MDPCWLAGFFDGEGCVGTAHVHGVPRVRITLTQRDRWILDEVREGLGYGVVKPTSNRRAYRYVVTSQGDVEKFIRLIYIHSRVKRRQLKLAYAIVRMRSSSGIKLGPKKRARRVKMHHTLSRMKEAR